MTRLHTRADFERLPLGVPVQLIEGCLVREPGPTIGHQTLISIIHGELLRRVEPARALMGPVDVAIDEHNVFQPDLVVLRTRLAPETQYAGVPLVAMEVLSPSTEQRDRNVKTGKLLALGVSEVWLIDRAGGCVEVHRGDGMNRFTGRQSARSDALPGFRLVPAELFTD